MRIHYSLPSNNRPSGFVIEGTKGIEAQFDHLGILRQVFIPYNDALSLTEVTQKYRVQASEYDVIEHYQQQLRKDLNELYFQKDEIQKMIDVLRETAKANDTEPYQQRDTQGNFVLFPLMRLKLDLMNTIRELEAKRDA